MPSGDRDRTAGLASDAALGEEAASGIHLHKNRGRLQPGDRSRRRNLRRPRAVPLALPVVSDVLVPGSVTMTVGSVVGLFGNGETATV